MLLSTTHKRTVILVCAVLLFVQSASAQAPETPVNSPPPAVTTQSQPSPPTRSQPTSTAPAAAAPSVQQVQPAATDVQVPILQPVDVPASFAPTRFNVWGELTLFSGSFFESRGRTDVVTLPTVFGSSIRLAPHVVMDARLPMTYIEMSDEDDSEARLRMGNPFASVSYLGVAGNVRYRVGGGMTLPVAVVPDDNATDALMAFYGYVYSGASHGFMDWWLWRPDTLSLVAPGRIETDLSNGFITLGGDAAFAVLISTDDYRGSRDSDVMTQFGADISLHVMPTMTIGGRLAGVWIMTGDSIGTRSLDLRNEDLRFQSSIEPFVRLNFGRAFVDGRFTLNLDRPAGFGFDTGRVWGLRVAGGATF